MNLEALQQRIRAVTELDWLGTKICVRKLSAKDNLELFAKLRASEDTQAASVEFHVELAARTLATESGDLEADSEEGRAILRDTPFDELVELGSIILRHSGHGEKKSSADPKCSHSDSAETLDPRSSIPIT